MPITAWGVASTLLGQKQRARYLPLLVPYFHTKVWPGLMMLVSSSGPSKNAGSSGLISASLTSWSVVDSLTLARTTKCGSAALLVVFIQPLWGSVFGAAHAFAPPAIVFIPRRPFVAGSERRWWLPLVVKRVNWSPFAT